MTIPAPLTPAAPTESTRPRKMNSMQDPMVIGRPNRLDAKTEMTPMTQAMPFMLQVLPRGRQNP